MALGEGDGVQPGTDAQEYQGLSQGGSFSFRASQGPRAGIFWKSKQRGGTPVDYKLEVWSSLIKQLNELSPRVSDKLCWYWEFVIIIILLSLALLPWCHNTLTVHVRCFLFARWWEKMLVNSMPWRYWRRPPLKVSHCSYLAWWSGPPSLRPARLPTDCLMPHWLDLIIFL